MQNFDFLQENVLLTWRLRRCFRSFVFVVKRISHSLLFSFSAIFHLFARQVALFAHFHRAAVFSVSKSIKPFVVVPVGCRVHYVKVEDVVVDVVVAEVDVVAVAVAEIVLKSLKSREVGQSS